ncbi:FecCD family ABC transporter permease [Gleimia hominis]|uniref:FecCD family ABC transporter permease n=1 Tax=Gleimia hominis TaxID=595468 RepID=UPI000C8015B5|nr:iron ABC transporter permease [Gleimia hominis]WIK63775.1 iron ABC transporter permease [Gleimia hominis]
MNQVARRTRRRFITFIVLVVALIAITLLNVAVGQYPVPLKEVLHAITNALNITHAPLDPVVESTLWSIRFPRVALGIIVGAALAVAGTVMQALFSNPLAEPGVVGVSSGASVGAAVAIVFAPTALGGYSVPIAAFITGLLASFFVYTLSRGSGGTRVITLVLTGIAVTAVCGALTAIATFIAPTTTRDQIVFWQMGSLNGASWTQVGTVVVACTIGIVWALSLAQPLDSLALGEAAAGHVGTNVRSLRLQAIIVTALLTASAVAYVGVVSFVGLVVPHVLRLVLGPINRVLLPASILGGALLISLSDLAARNLISFADLPIGVFTALVGGPTFFILLRTNLKVKGL